MAEHSHEADVQPGTVIDIVDGRCDDIRVVGSTRELQRSGPKGAEAGKTFGWENKKSSTTIMCWCMLLTMFGQRLTGLESVEGPELRLLQSSGFTRCGCDKAQGMCEGGKTAPQRQETEHPEIANYGRKHVAVKRGDTVEPQKWSSLLEAF